MSVHHLWVVSMDHLRTSTIEEMRRGLAEQEGPLAELLTYDTWGDEAFLLHVPSGLRAHLRDLVAQGYTDLAQIIEEALAGCFRYVLIDEGGDVCTSLTAFERG